MSQTNPDLLQEFENTVDLKPVSPGLRFVNYLIDVIAVYAIASIVGILFAVAALGAGTYDEEGTIDSGGTIQLLLLVVWLAIIFGYYVLLEYFAKGRTLGKMATGTMAVKEDGSNLSFKDAFLRTLCRFIPFEFISAFGYRPWHDSLTGTLVIKRVKRI